MKKYLWSLIFTLLVSNSSYACEQVGNSWVVRNTSYRYEIAKKNQKCEVNHNLTTAGGRLLFRFMEIIDATSDGTVLTEIKKNGENDTSLFYTAQSSGEHEITYRVRQIETDYSQYDMFYVIKLKVDMKFKDPGSLD